MHCAHHPSCPGCALAGTSYANQLVRKQQRLADALQWFAHLPAPEAIRGSEHTVAYRHRLKDIVQSRG